jgi:hypothetical protein
MVQIPNPDLHALACGEVVVAFVARGAATEGDEVELDGSGPRLESELKPAYRRWADEPNPEGRWLGIVDLVAPATILDPEAGASRHILMDAPLDGDVIILRVYGPDGAVLGDDAYAARRNSVEGALRG